MRSLIDAIYRGTAALGAACFVAVLVMILYQLGGQALPYTPRAADEFAGYFMGASAFLALADTLRSGNHIQVRLLVDLLAAGPRRVLAWLAWTLSTGLAAWVAWYFARMTWVSIELNELSAGLIAIPMWIPQAAMSWGAIVFMIAFLDVGVSAWRAHTSPDAGLIPEGGRGD
jgi:TRAP-type C4-dicarboxylate transport system permease small subunit